MDEEKRFRECPFCGGKAFTVDWSAMDRRSEPYTLRERYACNDCGKRMIQSYAYGGWKGNQGSGEGYLKKCPDCGKGELDVSYGEFEELSGNLEEDLRCSSCGSKYLFVWKPVSWAPEEEKNKASVNVIDHERHIIESDEDAEEAENDQAARIPENGA
jgi:DNA-directed RNA polymerase subunit RPC12/RpoP